MKINKLLSVLKQSPSFTKQNLGLALDKKGEDLNYWIKKLTQEKLLIPLKKGLYLSSHYQHTAINNPQEFETYWVYLANILRSPSYVSLEYILSKHSFIPEAATAITSITLKSSRQYSSPTNTFIYRHIKKELYCGYKLTVLNQPNMAIRIAYLYKAIFDFLYFKNPSSVKNLKYYLLKQARFNWDILTKTDKKNFTQIIKKSGSKKMQTIALILKKAKIL